ncbi:MAG: type II toxin-antitoxin system HicB family antitoxin [Chloroflexi bacterium]|nr:type II toxin-antitoxin system HicB family antitoxin [Chloroflexota bacterium]
MTQSFEYTVIAHDAEEGGYWTEVAGLPGAGSQGETLEEAIENTKESIQLVIETLREQGREVPIPKEVVVKVTVAA